MSKPAWLAQAEADHGARVMAGSETQGEAATALAALYAQHPEYLARLASARIGAWTRRHEVPDLFQASLFPLLPAYLPVAVNVSARVADMDLAALESASRMVMTRTGNVMRGARRQRKAFTDFYNQVQPLLKAGPPGMTVSDAVTRLTAQEAA